MPAARLAAGATNGTPTSGYAPGMSTNTFAEVQTLLEDLDFPADKDAIVRHATERGASEDSAAVRALRAMPLATYRNISEIRSSVDLDPEEMPG
ncbi:uncharacterized protein DUF2795 [Actinoplanes teichomyceticus]|uniref:Uncharacterized protein DUF2795 n=2 Tax=Actinoplanes teichomyceticus TaxID=1867 RepID=A0A561WK54_ACTTI|nr:uncharacterized protein DUF2795 [Actinoplanes teichomyceticus]GIF12913.1 hypothetical protein Ate01nite_29450 [Actinoplanes teichomyceticus]